MTLWSDRTRSKAGWLVWMVGAGYMRFNNFNYASHFHEMQFLHAMAPSSRGDPTSYREPRSMTRRKVLAWAEFAYLVAEGSIAPAMTMQEVHARLSKVARKPFELGFGLSNRRSVGFLFTGELDPDPLQVRQIAVGALLHTIQDSFSSSHVERVRSPRDGEGRQLVGDKGAIRRFLTYRGQDAVEHGVADRRPGDWDRANPGDLHPVSIGAQVVACAASTEGASPDLS